MAIKEFIAKHLYGQELSGKSSNDGFNATRFVIKAQAGITIFLFGMLGFMLGYVMFFNNVSHEITSSFLPIITGWIGIVIGFYFSREISGILEDKLRKEITSKYDEKVQPVIKEFETKLQEKERDFQTAEQIMKEEAIKQEKKWRAAIDEISQFYDDIIKKKEANFKKLRRPLKTKKE
jgi:hypothetical protein